MKKFIIFILTLFSSLVFSNYSNTSFALSSEEESTYGDTEYSDLFDDFGDTEDSSNEDESTDENSDETITKSMGTVYMNGERLDGDIFKLSILTSDMITPVLGIAFHLGYQKDRLAFLKYEPGEFLERGGDPFYLVKNEIAVDKIIFGETLRKDDSFPVGEGKIIDLYFQILNGETFDFEFQNGVVSTLDTVRQDINQIAWKNFTFDKNLNSASDLNQSTKASSFNIGKLNLSQILTSLAVLITATISSFLLISAIKQREVKLKRSRNIVNLLNA